MASNQVAFYAFATPSASGETQLIAATTGYRIVVLQVCVITGLANNLFFQSYDGTTFTPISATFPLAPNGGFVLPYSQLGWFQTNIGEQLYVNMSASSSTAIQIVYSLSSS